MIDHQPGSGCEVYSSTAIVPDSASDSTVIRERFGDQRERGTRSRLKFLDSEIVRRFP